MDRFPIRRIGDKVIVSLDRVLQSDKEAPAWNAAQVSI
jgi:hypothetical protein